MAKRTSRSVTLGLSTLVGLVGTTAVASAATTEIGPSANLGQEIAKLGPGDELVLQGGTYTLSAKLSITVKGTASAPITIRAKDGETPILTRDASQNVINIENTEYIVIRGLEVKNGSHGIRINNSSFITIEDCHIHDTGDVGLSANVPGSKNQGLVIRGNDIHHTSGTGEGMYLGCNNDGCQMFDSLIEKNHVHDTNQSSVSQGDGIEIKQGSYNNIVRDNVIHDTNYPCLLIYGTAGHAVNLLERNAMWNCGDHGIQAEADAIIRNNLILSAKADGIRNQLHQQQSVKDLTIVHNTVLNAGTAVRTDSVSGPVVIANNALYSQGTALRVSGDTSKITILGNVGMGSTQNVSGGFTAGGALATDFVDAAFGGAKLNVFPKAGSKLIAAGDTQYVTDGDFNGTKRNGVADVGAYKYDAAGNPGWPVGPGFKDITGSGGTAGSGGGGGSAGAATGGGGGAAGSAAGGASAGGSSAGGSSAGGSSAGGSSAGGSSAGGSSAGGSSSSGSSDDGGCGCRTRPLSPSPGATWLVLLGALGWSVRRRRAH